MKTSNKVKPSDILREAANCLLDTNSCCCYHLYGCCNAIYGASAILNASTVTENRTMKLFSSLFKNEYLHWFGNPGIGTKKVIKEKREHRVISLLLCADMCESVGL